jgi:hypothetical protein
MAYSIPICNACHPLVPLPLPNQPFDIAEMQVLFENGQLKNHLDAIKFIEQYWYETNQGDVYYFYDVDQDDFVFRTKIQFHNMIYKKLGNHIDIVKYFDTNNKIYSLVKDIHKPRRYQTNNKYYHLNLYFGFLHKSYL